MIEGIVDYLSPVTLTLTNSLKLLKDWLVWHLNG